MNIKLLASIIVTSIIGCSHSHNPAWFSGNKPLSELVKKLEQAGYTKIIEIELEEDHYDIAALDSSGKKVELALDPVTGEIQPD